MEHQAGAGDTGPAGENAARDGDSYDRERALADSADGTASAGPGQGDGTGGHASRSAAEPHGSRPDAPEVPAAQVPAVQVPAVQVPAVQVPAVQVPAGTGEQRVDAALKLLSRLPGLPVSDHPELFEQVHAQLSEVLGELDSGTGAAGPAAR